MSVIGGDLLTAAGGGSAMVALVWLAGKLLDKYKPKREKDLDLAAGYQDTIEFQTTQIKALLDEVAHIRQQVRGLVVQQHKLHTAVLRCMRDFPDTSNYWAEVMRGVEQ